MDLKSGELLQVIAKGEKCEYAFLFPKGAPVEEAIASLERITLLLNDLIKEKDKEAEEAKEETTEEE